MFITSRVIEFILFVIVMALAFSIDKAQQSELISATALIKSTQHSLAATGQRDAT